MNLSIVIPARNEPYLQNTIDDLFTKAENPIEVIAILDGYWPNPSLKDRKNLIIIHRGKVHGMRSSINTGARIAKGKYLMKCDAHCCFDKDFDLKLMGSLNSLDWVLVPIRYALDVDKWDRKGNPKEFQYIEKRTLKGRDWPEYAERVRDEIGVIDLMTTQGSCWFMSKDWFEKIGGIDEDNYGHMGREAQEVCLKTWTNGGRFLLTRGTWYAHWNKPREHVVTNRKEKQKSVDYAISYWTEDKIKPVIERFAPVPSWDTKPREEKIVTARHLESTNGVVKVAKEGMNRLGLYKYFASLGFKTGAEIGVQRGRNAIVMIDTIPDLKLYLIDPYKDYDLSNRHYGKAQLAKFRRMTHKRMRGKNVVFIEKFSEDAVREVPDGSLDFVYLDGMHWYDYAMLDIILWGRKVREGGIISGHDYSKNRKLAGVMEAVNDYVRTHKIEPLHLTDIKASRAAGDKCASWFFIKPANKELIGISIDCSSGRQRRR